ncbi:DUF262 domain-containing protein [Chamaesiphon sp. OTE_8_metabat_110]|uniref:DUF262 domain-containing protein n=1 Tax=Chamaesiphon sp. OTE_8_metabat_110 TaxID=2964696 RepID=UPI00286B2EB4|nr:DUF262 domain-containing protein [Chamaesiphon sp. OTE_8_metabat_110]
MKASEITRLTDRGTYQVDYKLNYLQKAIQEWQEEGLDLCPDFQRGHVWTVEQQIAFVEYILRGGKTSELLFNTKGNYANTSEDFVCVDGLQRLTALLLFLEDKLPVFGGYTRSQIEGIDILLRDLHLSFRINELLTRKAVLQWYLELNAGGTPHTDSEIDRVRDLLRKED